MKRRYLLVLVVLFLSSLTPFATAGEIAKDTCHHECIGLVFPVPAGWYVATYTEKMQAIEEGRLILGFDSPGSKEMSGKALFWMLQHRLDSVYHGFNRNILVVVINVRDHRDEIGSGADYLKSVSQGMKEYQPNAIVSEIATQRLGNQEFHKLDVSLPVQGITTYQRQLALIANDYVVIINIAAEHPDGLEEVSRLADGLHFSPVSLADEESIECRSLRLQAGIQRPRSSGNLLITLGIILMVAGGIWFLRGVVKKNEMKENFLQAFVGPKVAEVLLTFLRQVVDGAIIMLVLLSMVAVLSGHGLLSSALRLIPWCLGFGVIYAVYALFSSGKKQRR